MSTLMDGLSRYLDARRLGAMDAARVGIAGAGGLGSNVAWMLARSGVRRMTLVDFDVVEASNLNRQWYWPEDLGRRKVEALAERLLALRPDLELTLRVERIDAANARRLFGLSETENKNNCKKEVADPSNDTDGRERCGVVVEALDGAEDKAMLFAALAGRADFYVGASGLGGWGGEPMRCRRMGSRAVVVGDFARASDASAPPLAPRVTLAAAMQANAVIAFLQQDITGPGTPVRP